MRSSRILVLSFCLFFLTGSLALTTGTKQTVNEAQNAALLQTQSKTDAKAQTATGTGTETSCDPDCLFDYPYTDGQCGSGQEEQIIIHHEEHGETYIPPYVPPTEEVVIHHEEVVIIHHEEHGETIIPPPPYIPPTEEVVIRHEELIIIYHEEHGETYIPPPPYIPPTEEVVIRHEEVIIIHHEEHGETIIPPPPYIPPTEEVVIRHEEVIIIHHEEHGETYIPPPPYVPPTEEVVIRHEEVIFVHHEEHGETYIPPVIGEETIITHHEEEHIVHVEEAVIYNGEHGTIIDQGPECAYTASVQSGTTTAYGQPTTYLTYNLHDSNTNQDVSYTYVLTTLYSGTVQAGENEYVVYGTGAINFYNTYYGVNDYVTDKPGCSCICGYSSYTFSYSFDF